MRINKYVSLFLLVIQLVGSCKKNDLPMEEPPAEPPPIEFIEPGKSLDVNIKFHVVDDQNHPLQSAGIAKGNAPLSVQTDFNGLAELRDTRVYDSTSIKIGKFQHLPNYRNQTFENKRSYKISTMLADREEGIYHAAEGNEIVLQSGSKITIDPGFLWDETPYIDAPIVRGNFQVEATYLSPQTPNFLEKVPGNGRAIDSAGRPKFITPVSIVGFAIFIDRREITRTTEGKKISIELFIPSAYSNSPASIPLWFFDGQSGYWKQEGTATRNGNLYKASVLKAGYWACAKPFDTYHYKNKLIDASGNPLPYLKVEFHNETAALKTSVYTNDIGEMLLPLATNHTYKRIIFDNCGRKLLEDEIGPHSRNKHDSATTVPFNQIPTIRFKGTVYGCENKRTTFGPLTLVLNGATYYNYGDSSGFDFTLPNCQPGNASFTLSVRSHNYSVPNKIIEVSNFNGDTYDAGEIIFCDTSNETGYLEIEERMHSFRFSFPRDSMSVTINPDGVMRWNFRYLKQQFTEYYMHFKFPDTLPGIKGVLSFGMRDFHHRIMDYEVNGVYSNPDDKRDTVTVTYEISPDGKQYRGSFEGAVLSGKPFPIGNSVYAIKGRFLFRRPD